MDKVYYKGFRQDFVKEIRTYVGTPFGHQQRKPGIFIDCAGVLICASKSLGYEFDDLTNYSRTPSQFDVLSKIISSGFYDITLEEVIPGDIVLMAYEGNIQHIAVITENNPDIYILHAVTGKKVVEHRLNDDWKSKIRRVFRIKEEGEE